MDWVKGKVYVIPLQRRIVRVLNMSFCDSYECSKENSIYQNVTMIS